MDNINLTDYILARAWGKGETYNKTEISALLDMLRNQELDLFEIVTELPTTNIKTNKLYLRYNNGDNNGNLFDVFIYINGKWEQLDSWDINLSDYYTSTQLDNLLRLRATKEELVGVRDSLQETSASLTRLYNNLSAFNEILIQFDEDNNNLSSDLSKLKDNLLIFITRVNTMIIDIDSLEGGLNETKDSLQATSDSLQNTRATLTGLGEDVVELGEDLTDAKTEISETKGVLTQTRTELSDLNDELSEAKETFTGFESDLNTLQGQTTQLGNSLQGLSSDLNTTKSSLNTAKNELDTVKNTTIPSLQGSITTLNGDISRLDESTNNLDSRLTNLNTQLNSTTNSLTGVSDNLTSLTDRTTILETDIDGFKTNLNNLHNSGGTGLLDTTKSDLETLQDKVVGDNGIEKGLASLVLQANTLDANLLSLQGLLLNADGDLLVTAEDLSDLSDRLTDLTNDLSNLGNYLTDFEGDLTEFTEGMSQEELEKFNALNESMGGLFSAIASVKTNVATLEDVTIKQIQDDITTVHEDVYGTDSEGNVDPSHPQENGLLKQMEITQDNISNVEDAIDTVNIGIYGDPNNEEDRGMMGTLVGNYKASTTPSYTRTVAESTTINQDVGGNYRVTLTGNNSQAVIRTNETNGNTNFIKIDYIDDKLLLSIKQDNANILSNVEVKNKYIDIVGTNVIYDNVNYQEINTTKIITSNIHQIKGTINVYTITTDGGIVQQIDLANNEIETASRRIDTVKDDIDNVNTVIYGDGTSNYTATTTWVTKTIDTEFITGTVTLKFTLYHTGTVNIKNVSTVSNGGFANGIGSDSGWSISDTDNVTLKTESNTKYVELKKLANNEKAVSITHSSFNVTNVDSITFSLKGNGVLTTFVGVESNDSLYGNINIAHENIHNAQTEITGVQGEIDGTKTDLVNVRMDLFGGTASNPGSANNIKGGFTKDLRDAEDKLNGISNGTDGLLDIAINDISDTQDSVINVQEDLFGSTIENGKKVVGTSSDDLKGEGGIFKTMDGITNDEGTGSLDQSLKTLNGDPSSTDPNKKAGIIKRVGDAEGQVTTSINRLDGITNTGGTGVLDKVTNTNGTGSLDKVQGDIYGTKTVNGETLIGTPTQKYDNSALLQLDDTASKVDNSIKVIEGDPNDPNDKGVIGKLDKVIDDAEEVKESVYGEGTVSFDATTTWKQYTIDTSKLTGTGVIKFSTYHTGTVCIKTITGVTNGNFTSGTGGLGNWIISDSSKVTVQTESSTKYVRLVNSSTQDKTPSIYQKNINYNNVNSITFYVKTPNTTGTNKLTVYTGTENNMNSGLFDGVDTVQTDIDTVQTDIGTVQNAMYGDGDFNNPSVGSLCYDMNDAEGKVGKSISKIGRVTNDNQDGLLDLLLLDFDEYSFLTDIIINTINQLFAPLGTFDEKICNIFIVDDISHVPTNSDGTPIEQRYSSIVTNYAYQLSKVQYLYHINSNYFFEKVENTNYFRIISREDLLEKVSELPFLFTVNQLTSQQKNIAVTSPSYFLYKEGGETCLIRELSTDDYYVFGIKE